MMRSTANETMIEEPGLGVKLTKLLATGFALAFLAGCNKADGVYTLYRDSVTGDGMRIHLATFDSGNGDAYNRENCEVATHLFAEQPGVKVKYWCEKGPFRR